MFELLLAFTMTINGEDWRVFINDEIPCVGACIVPFAKFMYLDTDWLDVVDPWGMTPFEHELKHILEPDWRHDRWYYEEK